MTTARFRTILAAGFLSLAVGAAAVPAGASTPSSGRPKTVAAAKARCDFEIQRREFTLTIAKDRIATARRLSDEQKATMTAGIDAVMAHLRDVNRPALQAATTRATVQEACKAIILDNRVYVVVVPQLMLTIRAEQLLDGHDTLVVKSAEKAAAGKDVSTLNQQLADAKAKIDPALAAVAAVTPASYNADPTGTQATFDSARTQLQEAFNLLLSAIATYRDL